MKISMQFNYKSIIGKFQSKKNANKKKVKKSGENY